MQAQQQSGQPHILQNHVVVFSKNYLPLARVNIKRAIVLLITGQAELLEFSSAQSWEVRSSSLVLQISEHIRLTTHLTLDHVIPRSKGGTHTWDNVVTACQKCNSAKSDRLLHETGMILRTKLKAPMHPAFASQFPEGVNVFAEQFWKEQAD